MDKLFWWNLNPIEKFNRYKWVFLLLPILIVVLCWKFKLGPALVLSFVFIELSYTKYELLKLKADLYEKEIIEN